MTETKSTQCGICGQPVDNGWIHDVARGYEDFSTQSCYNPSPSKSAQPQVPPLITWTVDGVWVVAAHEAEHLRNKFLSALAENESLKAKNEDEDVIFQDLLPGNATLYDRIVALKEQITEAEEVIEEHKEARREASRIIQALRAERDTAIEDREDAEKTASRAEEALQYEIEIHDGIVKLLEGLYPGLDVNGNALEYATIAVSAIQTERDKALEVIREYRKGGKHQGCNDLIEWQFDGKDHRCPTCIKADILLKEKSQSLRKAEKRRK